jgi:nitrate/nitrite transport system permease protein
MATFRGLPFARTLGFRAALLSGLILLLLLLVWQLATQASSGGAAPAAKPLTAEQIEYAKLMGKDPTAGAPAVAKSGFPTPGQMGSAIVAQLASPFYDNGPNDKGIRR